MADISVNGIRLYYEEHGSGDPILVIHGTSSSAAVWGPALPALGEHGRVIAYDRRGSFRSERPVPYDVTTVPEHADDAAELIDALGLAPAIVIGRSYGGETGLSLAMRYPDKVRGLALLEAAVLSLSDEARRWTAQLTKDVLQTAERQPDKISEVFLRNVMGDAMWESLPPDARAMFNGNGPTIAAEFRGGVLQTTLEEISKITVPVLLVAAKDSPPAFRDVTERMAEALPHARLAYVDGGHFINPAIPPVIEFVDDIIAGRA